MKLLKLYHILEFKCWLLKLKIIMKNINKKEVEEQIKVLELEMLKLKKIIEKKESIFERIQNLQDVYDDLGIKNENDFLPFIGKNINDFQEKMNNISRLLKVEECYAEGWKRNWNGKQHHYYPYFTNSGGSWLVDDCGCACSVCDVPLVYFETLEKAKDAGTKFIDLFNKIRN